MVLRSRVAVIGTALLCLSVTPSRSQQTGAPDSDKAQGSTVDSLSTPPSASPSAADTKDVANAIAATEVQLAKIDALIVSLDERLESVYDQRDLVEDDPARKRTLDVMIDRLNLTLTEMEKQRDQLAAVLGTLKQTIAANGAAEETQ